MNRREFCKGMFACAVSLVVPGGLVNSCDDSIMMEHLGVIAKMLNKTPLPQHGRMLYVPEATYEYLQQNFDQYIDNFIEVEKVL